MDFEHAEARTGTASAQPLQSPLERDANAAIAATAPGAFRVIRRNGKVTAFDGNKIKVALTKAFLAVEGHSAAASTRIHNLVEELTTQIIAALTRRIPAGGATHIEDIQDQVELALMRGGQHKVARSYVLYREERAQKRKLGNNKSRSSPAKRSRSPCPMAIPNRSTTIAFYTSSKKPARVSTGRTQ